MAEQQYGVLEGTFAFMKLAEPSTKYQSEDLEYSVDVIVSKKVAKEWNKQFAKQKAREIEPSEFETKYKMPIPEDVADEDEIYVIKLKKGATKDGVAFDDKFRPKLLLDTAEGRVDITVSCLAANGTKGKASYRTTSNDFGVFAQLNNILVAEEDFKEYVRSGGVAGSEFGDAKPIAKVEPESKAATASRPKVAKKPEPEDEDEEDKSPF